MQSESCAHSTHWLLVALQILLEQARIATSGVQGASVGSGWPLIRIDWQLPVALLLPLHH